VAGLLLACALACGAPEGERDGVAAAAAASLPVQELASRSAPDSRSAADSASGSRRAADSAAAPLAVRVHPAAAPPSPIELDPLEPDAVTARVRGFDPAAPRPLLLWRPADGHAAVMARGASRPDGSLDFPEIAIPAQGLEVLVTAAGETPASASASLPRTVAPRAPLAPRAQPRPRARGAAVVLRVVPSEAGGEVLLASAPGQVFARHPVPARPDAAGRGFDIELRLAPGDTQVWLAHETHDGRRSAWRPVELDPVHRGEMP
jgi:hypothetical protein